MTILHLGNGNTIRITHTVTAAQGLIIRHPWISDEHGGWIRTDSIIHITPDPQLREVPKEPTPQAPPSVIPLANPKRRGRPPKQPA